ncbi:DNA-binding transcriptional regulator, PucR family [Parafrankia irregularis]|uniref:DNA-binding transcriptional regulator, PucR family n=1 Tax=Parafrankia irregularis TaxID=795642 RepID=A0A0S4QF15_9ACTN|nr:MULTISPECIES: PucR family transcriptional regulator [Parafrankia]MBE3203285.1 PucR family transcriptional regulator [Parafrankia sp. CH37]CUU54067.1 DNA-binding transcriptional regulator, PucR family [Parafrankia irregularis]
MSWDLPPSRIRELLRRGAELVLHPKPEWLDELDAATLAGPARQQVAEDPVLAAAIRRSNRSNLRYWAAANIRAPGERVPADLGDVPLAVARDLVRRGLDDAMLGAYRSGQSVALRYWIEIVFTLTSDPEELQVLLDVSCRSIATYIEDTVDAIAAQMDRERADLTHGTHAERREAVTLLLDGAPLSPQRAQQRLGYRLEGAHWAAVIWSDDPDIDLADLDRAADLLAVAAGDPRPLTVLASAATRWVWVHGEPDLARLHATAAEIPAARIAIGRRRVDLDGFRRSHHDALTVQRMLARLGAPRQIATYADVELVALLTADRERADQFVAGALGDLATAPPELREAVRTFVAAGCNATAAAARLYTHRNTLLRRLARAERLLPVPLADNLIPVAAALEIQHWHTGT